MPYPYQAHVCAAKAGVERLAQVLALEWGPLGIRSNLINPGPIDDTEGMRRLAPTPEARAATVKSIPLGRMGTKQDIANLALFLCSDAASFISGGVFHCDGAQGLLGARAFSEAVATRSTRALATAISGKVPSRSLATVISGDEMHEWTDSVAREIRDRTHAQREGRKDQELPAAVPGRRQPLQHYRKQQDQQ